MSGGESAFFAFLAITVMGLIAIGSSATAQIDIANSCNITGTFVVNNQAYECRKLERVTQ